MARPIPFPRRLSSDVHGREGEKKRVTETLGRRAKSRKEFRRGSSASGSRERGGFWRQSIRGEINARPSIYSFASDEKKETDAYLYAKSRRNDRDAGSRRFEEEGKGNARKSTLYFEQGTGLQQEINFAGAGAAKST
jgi:hypothetical protein